jgi:hypothetical protein
MKSILITFILSSVTLAASGPATTNGLVVGNNDDCTPIKLYRKRSIGLKNIYESEEGSINVIDHFETTDEDEKNDKYALERQIATICSNQATGTFPLYHGQKYISHIQREMDPIVNATQIFGYVYTAPQGAASLLIFKKLKSHKINGIEQALSFLVTENINEANQHGYNTTSPFFYSLPLNFKQT